MKLEFFEDAFEGSGVLLLYGGSRAEIESLRASFEKLEVVGASIPLHESSFIEPVANCQLTAVSVPKGLGVHRPSAALSFRWALSPSEWEDAGAMLQPFCDPSDAQTGTRFQYLNPHDGPEVIYSTTRSW